MKRLSSNEEESPNEDECTGEEVHMVSPEVKNITIATHAIIVLYAMCFWIQIGVMPYLTRKLDVDTKMFGYLQSVFAFIQLCGGPLYGRFGDLFGGKYALILASSACVMSYGLLATATSIPFLFLSRLPSLAMHSMQGSQMVITDVTSNKERSSGIGRLGISYGVGMVIGPLLGGFITDRISTQAAAGTAAVGSIVSILIVIWAIPTDTKQFVVDHDKEKESLKATGSVFDYHKYISILQVENFAYLFLLKALSGLPLGIFQAMFSVFAMDYFHLQAKENGMVLSFVGVMGMLVQGFGVGFLTSRYKEDVLIKYSIITITLGYILMIFVTNIVTFLAVLVPIICGGLVFTVIITSLVTKSVSHNDTGTALGLNMATHSMIRTVSPTIGGLLYSRFGFPVFGISGTIINGSLALYLLYQRRHHLQT